MVAFSSKLDAHPSFCSLFLSFLLPLLTHNRTVVSKQAEFEKAVFAKTARVNARGDGEREKKKRRESERCFFFSFPFDLHFGLTATTPSLSQKKKKLKTRNPLSPAEITLLDDAVVLFKVREAFVER